MAKFSTKKKMRPLQGGLLLAALLLVLLALCPGALARPGGRNREEAEALSSQQCDAAGPRQECGESLRICIDGPFVLFVALALDLLRLISHL